MKKAIFAALLLSLGLGSQALASTPYTWQPGAALLDVLAGAELSEVQWDNWQGYAAVDLESVECEGMIFRVDVEEEVDPNSAVTCTFTNEDNTSGSMVWDMGSYRFTNWGACNDYHPQIEDQDIVYKIVQGMEAANEENGRVDYSGPQGFMYDDNLETFLHGIVDGTVYVRERQMDVPFDFPPNFLTCHVNFEYSVETGEHEVWKRRCVFRTP